MNKFVSNLSRLAAVFITSALLNAVIVLAADAPADPARPNVALGAPAAPAPADNAANPGRQGRRGNANAGNPNQGGGGNLQGGRGNNFGGGPGGGFNLDDKQRELFREAIQNESEELRKLNDKLQAAQKEMVQVVVAEKYDEKAVREKAEAVSKMQTEITMLRAKAFSSVSPTLKPEQREQLDQNSRIGLGFIMGGGIGFGGGGNFAGGNLSGGGGRGGNGGPPADVTQGGSGRGGRGGGNLGGTGGTGGNGGAPDQPRRRGGQGPGQ